MIYFILLNREFYIIMLMITQYLLAHQILIHSGLTERKSYSYKLVLYKLNAGKSLEIPSHWSWGEDP